MKAILLIRVSTEAQDLVQQRERVVDAAKRDGYDELILIEDKESAVKLSEEERNGLNRLKETIEHDSSVKAVYAYEISRISRRPDVVFSIRNFLIEHKVQLIILNPYFKMLKDDGTLSETSNIFFGIFASMAENEGYIRKARTIRGKEKKKALGLHYTGRVPFGYKTNKLKEYVLDPMTAPLVKKIFNMYVKEDVSLRNIVKELQSQGFFTNITFHGCVRNIHEMLHREYYCGTVKGYPQIISKELFDKAQEIKKRNTIVSPRTENKALLKGLLFNKSTGNGNYEHILKQLRLVRRENIPIGLNAVVQNDDICNIEDLLHFAVENGVALKLLPQIGLKNSSLFKEKIYPLLKRFAIDFVDKGTGATRWTIQIEGNNATVLYIDSPCFAKDINTCRMFGELRIHPDFKVQPCIMKSELSQIDLSKGKDEVIKELSLLWNNFKNC